MAAEFSTFFVEAGHEAGDVAAELPTFFVKAELSFVFSKTPSFNHQLPAHV